MKRRTFLTGIALASTNALAGPVPAKTDRRAAGPYDIFVNIWQSNNFSSYHRDLAVDVGHARIFQMEYNGGLPGPITQVTGEPLSYGGAVNPAQPDGPPIGHILAFCRDYYLPNRLATGRNILIIPCAVGGTGFSNYFINGTRPGWGIVGGVGGLLHERTITRVNAAMAAHPGSVIKACFCQGGEADAFWRAPKLVNGTTTSYYENLEAATPGAGIMQSFIDYTVAEVADFRARWTSGTNVPFLFGRMSPNYALPPIAGVRTSPGFMVATDYAIAKMPTHVSNSTQVPTDGLTTNNAKIDGSGDWYGTANYIHFDAESQRGSATQTNPLSKRYWVRYQTLVPQGLGRDARP
jgi:hypothetical protein